MSRAPVFFAAGILLTHQFTQLPAFAWLAGGLIAALLLIRYTKKWNLAFLLAGVLWTSVIAGTRLQDRLPADLERTDIRVTGKVIGLPQRDSRKVSFDFEIIDAPWVDRDRLPEKIRLSWYFPGHRILAGQIWKMTVRLKKPHGYMNPGGFDYQYWLLSRNLGATGYVRKNPFPQLLGKDSAWFSIPVWRQTISDRIDNTFGRSDFGLIRALTLGDRSGITADQWRLFNATGTGHLVAISGLHIGLIAGLTYWLAVNFWTLAGIRRFSPSRIGVIAGLAAALLYSALAGFTVPTQRALIMLAVVFTGLFLRRNVRPAQALLMALFLVSLLDPFAVRFGGYWLSFWAVAIIAYTLSARRGRQGYWMSLARMQWALALGLLPLSLFFFAQVPWLSPLANFLAVPLVSLVIIPLALLSVLLAFIWPGAAIWLNALNQWLITNLSKLLALLADIPLAVCNGLSVQPGALLLALAGALWLLAPKGVPARYLGIVLLVPLFGGNTDDLYPGDVRMTLLDVGQGLSVVLRTANHAMVYDTGAKFSAHSDIGRQVLMPYLHEQNIQAIDRLIISHNDIDHKGGAESLLDNIPAKRIYSSSSDMLDNFDKVLCQAGQSWSWDNVEFFMFAPAGVGFNEDNNQSCVLKVSTKHGSILLTGDIESEVEEWLVHQYGQKLSADILLAPHHGSNTSSTQPFLDRVDPDYVLISAGYRNRFGFPDPEVIDKYRARGATWLNTAESGAIMVELKSQGISLEAYRKIRKKYWH